MPSHCGVVVPNRGATQSHLLTHGIAVTDMAMSVGPPSMVLPSTAAKCPSGHETLSAEPNRCTPQAQHLEEEQLLSSSSFSTLMPSATTCSHPKSPWHIKHIWLQASQLVQSELLRRWDWYGSRRSPSQSSDPSNISARRRSIQPHPQQMAWAFSKVLSSKCTPNFSKCLVAHASTEQPVLTSGARIPPQWSDT